MNDVTTFCSLWKLEIPSRVPLFLTDHDDVILYEGHRYFPQNAADPVQAERRLGMSVDSGGLRMSLTVLNLSPEDIRNGLLDGAQLSQFRHDWRSGDTQLLSKGRVGDVSFSGEDINIEWLGQASLLDRSTGRVFSRQCDASFGDARCGLASSAFPKGTHCPRSFTACREQFENAVNFRGFPYLLGDDLLQSGLRETDTRDGSSRYR